MARNTAPLSIFSLEPSWWVSATTSVSSTDLDLPAQTILEGVVGFWAIWTALMVCPSPFLVFWDVPLSANGPFLEPLFFFGKSSSELLPEEVFPLPFLFFFAVCWGDWILLISGCGVLQSEARISEHYKWHSSGVVVWQKQTPPLRFAGRRYAQGHVSRNTCLYLASFLGSVGRALNLPEFNSCLLAVKS